MDKKQEAAVEDPWALVDPPDSGKPWRQKNIFEKLFTIILFLLKIATLLALLYLFVCSLDFLSNAFRLLGGKAAGESFTENEILNNPIANLMMGVLATVLLQSSSTTTSIVVAMVSAELLKIRPAIFVIMGANIGTSVTNTLVAMTQSMKRSEFRRAFAGATVHDMFNWLCVLILLPIEWISGSFGDWKDCGVLCQITGEITHNLEVNSSRDTDEELLKVITAPFTKKIIQVDKKKITAIATRKNNTDTSTLIHQCSEDVYSYYAGSMNGTCVVFNTTTEQKADCGFLFEPLTKNHSDAVVGVCLLLFALTILCVCLVLIVKLLHSMLRGAIARIIKKFLNSDFPGKLHFLTGYVAILIGAGLTMLVQSSSIFTSAVTPLVGVGVLHIERMYPLTLGSNVGTTLTAILAALASDPDRLHKTLQIALCHLFFNVIGIIIWYPVPYMRAIPVSLAKMLGNTTAKYRWFAVLYIIMGFFLLPGIVFALSTAGWYVCLGVLGPIALLLVVVAIINVLQKKHPKALCPACRTWDWLPLWLRSLQPYDDLISACFSTKTPLESETPTDASSIEVDMENTATTDYDDNSIRQRSAPA